METRTITVVMPAFDVERFVSEAVLSVLDQTWPEIQLVAIDDGSSDRTLAILQNLADERSAPGRRIDLVERRRGGAGAARNAGLDRAEGRFVAFLDADDRWHPRLLERLAAALEADPGLDLVFPLYRYIDEVGRPIGVESRAEAGRYGARDLLIANPVHSATGVLVRRTAVEAAGRFDESLPACIDLDFWVRIVRDRADAVAAVPEVLADYRKRSGQITGDWRRMETGWTRVCAKAEAAGYGLDRADRNRGRARHCLYWSSIAYASGDYAATRRLIAEFWRRDPRFAASDRLARIRTLSGFASLLPDRLHHRIRDGFNASPRAGARGL